MGNEKGFTLIEIMIAVVVIGLLTSIAIPTFNAYRVKAYNANATSDVRNLHTHQSMFKNDHGIYAPIAVSDKGSTGLISVNVTMPSGGTELFELRNLSADTQLIAKTDANKINVILGCRHQAGNKIVAIDPNNPAIKEKASSTTLTAADLPTPTSADDLSSWSVLE